jgi:hypothetical protein
MINSVTGKVQTSNQSVLFQDFGLLDSEFIDSGGMTMYTAPCGSTTESIPEMKPDSLFQELSFNALGYKGENVPIDLSMNQLEQSLVISPEKIVSEAVQPFKSIENQIIQPKEHEKRIELLNDEVIPDSIFNSTQNKESGGLEVNHHENITDMGLQMEQIKVPKIEEVVECPSESEYKDFIEVGTVAIFPSLTSTNDDIVGEKLETDFIKEREHGSQTVTELEFARNPIEVEQNVIVASDIVAISNSVEENLENEEQELDSQKVTELEFARDPIEVEQISLNGTNIAIPSPRAIPLTTEGPVQYHFANFSSVPVPITRSSEMEFDEPLETETDIDNIPTFPSQSFKKSRSRTMSILQDLDDTTQEDKVPEYLDLPQQESHLIPKLEPSLQYEARNFDELELEEEQESNETSQVGNHWLPLFLYALCFK